MYHPTTRVLTVLELLQSHRRMTGAELAERLEVDIRTARRYVERLQDLGIPVEAERGRYGAYRLRPGYKLPPLMFTEEEALALTLGLLAARRLGLAATAPAVEGALAKVERVLPDQLRARVQAVQETLVFDLEQGEDAPDKSIVLTLSVAARDSRRTWMRYRSLAGEETERLFDPYGLVFQDGHWYATGYCHLRQSQRLFRLERILQAELREETFTRPEGFDPLEDVTRALVNVPRASPVEVLLETTMESARRVIPPQVAALEETAGGVLFRCRTDNITWLAHLLAGSGLPLIVREPPELREALKQHALNIMRYAEREANR
jgi:predicted DNA-binding transcriptional regulator YafY